MGWDLSSSLSSYGVLRAFYRALNTRSVSKGLIVHSDRGVQYTSKAFRDKLKDLGFIQSMSRCLVAGEGDMEYKIEKTKEELWDKYYIQAPAQLRQPVEKYKIVKRA